MSVSLVDSEYNIVIKTVTDGVPVSTYENGNNGNPTVVNLSGEYLYMGANIDNPNMALIANKNDPTETYWIKFNMYTPYSGDSGLVLDELYNGNFEAYKRQYKEIIAKLNEASQNRTETNANTQNQVSYSALSDSDGDLIICVDESGGYMNENGTPDLGMEMIIRSYGLPPQWTKYVDPRLYSFDGYSNAKISLGRRFMQVTISNPTLIEIAPGYIKYCDGITDAADKTNVFQEITEETAAETIAEALKEDEGFLYTIKPCFADMRYPAGKEARFPGYISYVNCLMSIVSVFLSRVDDNKNQLKYYEHTGVEAKKDELKERLVPSFGISYKLFTWEEYDNPNGKRELTFLGLNLASGYADGNSNGKDSEDPFTYIRFYAVGNTKSTDTFSTSTGPSAIANMINSVTDGAKDFAFILNGIFGSDDGNIRQLLGDVEGEINGLLDSITFGLSGIVQSMFGGLSTITGGGKMLFPDIIEDCTYGKSISCECTFTSIYGDTESILLNVIAPYIHILAFTLPHQVRNGIDIYTFPFLVKAFAKGIFNCSMGAITNFTVSRGGSDDELWSLNKVPTEITVSFEITPMISKLVMSSKQDGIGWILKNYGLQEYLSSLCGVDLRNNQFNMAMELHTALTSQSLVSYRNNTLTRILNSEFGTTLRMGVNKFGNYDFGSDISNRIDTAKDVINYYVDNLFG